MNNFVTRRELIMIGTDPNAKGGIATIVTKYRQIGLFEKWRVTYLLTHAEGSIDRKLAVALNAYWRMFTLLLNGHIGLLHIHVASRASTWRKSIFAITAFFFRVPYVLHLHGAGFVEFFHDECGPVRRMIIRGFLKRAGTVIALSESWATQLRQMEPEARVEVVYNSVSLPSEQSKYIHSEQKKEILFLGQIGERKGAFDLIRAFAVAGCDAELVLGGDGDIDRAAGLAWQLGVSEHVHFLGWVTGADKDALLAMASVFVLPSYNEGLPMSVLEAMAWGVPVITTPVGGIPEVVRQNKEGLIVPPGDIHRLSEALCELLRDAPLRERLGDNGRARVQNVFSDTVVLPRLEAIWARFGLFPLYQTDC
jgi:glycosyltransferase involved in cell wall biosynthesis